MKTFDEWWADQDVDPELTMVDIRRVRDAWNASAEENSERSRYLLAQLNEAILNRDKAEARWLKLEAELAAEREVVDFYADKDSWLTNYENERFRDHLPALDCDFIDSESVPRTYKYGGKRARERQTKRQEWSSYTPTCFGEANPSAPPNWVRTAFPEDFPETLTAIQGDGTTYEIRDTRTAIVHENQRPTAPRPGPRGESVVEELRKDLAWATETVLGNMGQCTASYEKARQIRRRYGLDKG